LILKDKYDNIEKFLDKECLAAKWKWKKNTLQNSDFPYSAIHGLGGDLLLPDF